MKQATADAVVLSALDLTALATVIDCANDHIEDIKSGLSQGIYLKSDNCDLPKKIAAVAAIETAYRASVATAKKSTQASTPAPVGGRPVIEDCPADRKFAILVGSIAGGFAIESIVGGASSAEATAINHLVSGALAEAIEIKKPSSKSRRQKDHDCGMDYVAFSSSISNGFELYGPFPDWESANDFGEAHRGPEEDWEHFSFDQHAPAEATQLNQQ